MYTLSTYGIEVGGKQRVSVAWDEIAQAKPVYFKPTPSRLWLLRFMPRTLKEAVGVFLKDPALYCKQLEEAAKVDRKAKLSAVQAKPYAQCYGTPLVLMTGRAGINPSDMCRWIDSYREPD
jgi:hypothetical protein